jgi:hypothetical protein
MNILKGMHPRSWWRKEKSLGLGRWSENDILPVTGIAWVIVMLSTVVFMGTNFIAWNFCFPTRIERLLWRLSSCGLVVILGCALPCIELLYSNSRIKTIQRTVQKRREALEDCSHPSERAKWKDRLVCKFRILAMKIRNNSPEKYPNLDMSLLFIFMVVPTSAVYILFELIFWWGI